ncbi:MAG: hypothetical protein H7832_13810 [Magnetococcus sp. DMHC-6]
MLEIRDRLDYLFVSRRHKIVGVLVSFCLFFILLFNNFTFFAVFFLLLPLWLLWRAVSNRLHRLVSLLWIAWTTQAPKCHSNEALAALGLTVRQMDDIQNQGKTEVVLAEWGAENRILSHVGPIPVLGEVVLHSRGFQLRAKNQTQLVWLEGALVLKKRYLLLERFINEVLALHALRHESGFPRLYRVVPERKILYREFILAEDLGRKMAQKGFLEGDQERTQFIFLGADRNGQKITPRPGDEILREQALQTLRLCVEEPFLQQAAQLLHTIHRQGLAYRDLKYGNLLIHNGAPMIVDFDIARRYPRHSPLFAEAVRHDWCCFQHLFAIAPAHSEVEKGCDA